jgi:hypothetical protein
MGGGGKAWLKMELEIPRAGRVFNNEDPER